MGNARKFRKKATVFILKFEGDDEELDGLEVTIRSLPIREFLMLATLSEDIEKQGGMVAREMMRIFSEALIEWNLEDEGGREVPADLGGIHSMEMDFIMRIITAWMQKMGGVEDPLPPASSDGEPSLEELMKMEIR